MHALPEQAQLGALDDQFQAKVLAEVERQQLMEAEAAAAAARWDAQAREAEAAAAALLQEVTADFSQRQQVGPGS